MLILSRNRVHKNPQEDFHNLKNRDKESLVIQINKTLHKNWTILNSTYKIYRSNPIKKEIANNIQNKFEDCVEHSK